MPFLSFFPKYRRYKMTRFLQVLHCAEIIQIGRVPLTTKRRMKYARSACESHTFSILESVLESESSLSLICPTSCVYFSLSSNFHLVTFALVWWTLLKKEHNFSYWESTRLMETFYQQLKTAASQLKVKKFMGLSELIIPQLHLRSSKNSVQVTCTKYVG